jgi:hypothetical protein
MSELDRLVDTLLWEGHQLYPYTPSATKNLTPTPFGIAYPPAYAAGDPHRFARCKLQAIVTGTRAVDATIHCLAGGRAQRIDVAPGRDVAFAFDDGVRGSATLALEEFGELARVTVEVRNETTVGDRLDRAGALARSLLSTHLVLRCGLGGRFFSPVTPPEEAAAAVMACAHVNTHPVLATPGDDAILGAAIFLPDHPQIAPESTGSLFDGTEIEEALLLHVLALSDAERTELETADPAVRAMVARAAAVTPSDIMALHGRVIVTDPAPAPADEEIRGEDAITAGGRTFRRGEHVVLRPGPGRGAGDHLLVGRTATIERIYIDYDDDVHLCVTVDDDPGQQLMRDIGRYLYFKTDEVEAI